MEDPKFPARRRKMVEELSRNPLNFDPAVLEAIGKVPRQYFCDPATYSERAYMDITIPILADQTLSQPSTVAREMSLLELKRGEKILEIGTGSGYQTACLYAFGLDIHSIERQTALFNQTSKIFKVLGINVHNVCGDGYLGMPEAAPFDKILVTAAAQGFPGLLVSQLKVGGIMVTPIEQNGECFYYKIVRRNETEYDVTKYEACRFVPMLQGIN